VDDAIDTIRNQRVRATHATASRFPDRYICPLCRTEVSLAWGDIVRKHFRHVRGTDHEECERYAKNFGREVPLSQHEYEHLDAIMVATQATTRTGTQVALAIRFRPPKTPARVKLTGEVQLVSGSQTTTYTVQPGLRQQYFRITSPQKQYLIRAKTNRGGQLQYPVEGFEQQPAVFRATDREAVRIPAHRLLTPGGYIVVSTKPIRTFHSALAAEHLQTLTGLHATLIQIPENPTAQLRQNITSLLGFELTLRMAVYGFLCPANVYEIAPDSWEVSSDAELAILIRVSREDAPRFTRLLIQHRLSGHLTTEYLPWKQHADQFVIQFDPAPHKTDMIRIGLATTFTDTAWFVLEVNFSEDPVPLRCSRIQFQFASQDNRKSHLNWSAHELPARLIEAAREETRLLTISNVPKAVEIAVSDAAGRRETIPEPSAPEYLIKFLRTARFPCVLATSGYPSIRLFRQTTTSQPKLQAAETPSPVPRSRQQARLLDAYKRGLVSRYALRSSTL
jgi:hypothetical protein